MSAISYRLEDALAEFVTTRSLPGMSVSVTLPDGERFDFQHGHRADRPELPIDADTIFAVASVTKTFTAMAAVLLERSQLLCLDDPLSTWLPHLRLPDFAEQRIRVRHLLSHTSGLPGLPLIHGARTPSILADPDHAVLADRAPIARDWMGIRSVSDLVEALNRTQFTLLGGPGEVFNYSNEGFGLAQGIIEAAAGRGFAEVLATEVFAPLSVPRFAFTAQELQRFDNIVPLFAPMRDDAQRYSPSPSWWDVGDILSNGSLKISSSGMVRIADALRNLSMGRDAFPWLGTRGVARLTHPEATLPDSGRYALGLELHPVGERSWFGHGGSIKGASTQFRCYPDEGLSIVCFINASGAPVAAAVDMIVEVILEETRQSGVPRYEPEQQMLAEAVGHYESQELNEIDIRVQDGRLRVRRNGSASTQTLYPTGPDAFTTEDGQSLVLMRDGDGRVNAAFASKRVHPRTGS